jgi:hypothetical protein
MLCDMLELRPSCEHCGRALPPESTEAMICTFECTFCRTCVDGLLANVCPNCGGGFERRPVRPARLLAKHPAASTPTRKTVDEASFARLLEEQRGIAPHRR